MNIEQLPHHEEYEQGILSAVLVEGALYPQMKAALKFSDFYATKHRLIAITMDEMRHENIPIELITVRDALEQKGELEKVGGAMYLTYLTELSYMTPNLHYYIGVVKEDACRRDIWFSAQSVAQAVTAGKPRAELQKLIEKVRGTAHGQSQNELKPLSASELESLPPPKSLWADIIYPGCLIQLNAEPGIGKSTFAYNICALGALEKPFLDIPFTKQIKSLYVDLETTRQLRPNKINLIANGLPESFYILESLELRRNFGDLLALCNEEKYDLLVFDTQSRVLAMEQENDNSEANMLVGLLRRIANESGCAILLIHHSTKGEGGKAVYRGRGASAIAGAVDVVLNMQSVYEDTLKLSVDKHRIQGSRPDIYMRKAGDDKFEVVNSAGNTEPTLESHIVELLTSSPESLQTNEIILEMQYRYQAPKRVVERALQNLSYAGKVVKIRRGYYTVPEADEPPLPPTLYPGGNGGS